MKKEIRYPIMTNFAINGFGKVITIEKIIPQNCPLCGGEMKYYNKIIEKRYSPDGEVSYIKTPALECLRNEEHWFKVDTTEDLIIELMER